MGRFEALKAITTLSCREDTASGMVVVVSKATSTPLSDFAPRLWTTSRSVSLLKVQTGSWTQTSYIVSGTCFIGYWHSDI